MNGKYKKLTLSEARQMAINVYNDTEKSLREDYENSDGWLIGGDKWNATRLQECTPEAKMKIIINTYRSRLFFEIGIKVEDNKFREESAKTYERVAEAMGIDYKQIAKDCGYEENEA